MQREAAGRRKTLVILATAILLSLLCGVIAKRQRPESSTAMKHSVVSLIGSKSAETEAGQANDDIIEAPKTPKATTRLAQILLGEEEADKFQMSEQEIFSFLQSNRSNALSLVTAFEASHNREYLREAARLHPTNALALAKALMHDVAPEKRAEWIAAFKANDPDNKFANMLAAHQALKDGDVTAALGELASMAGKGFNDFTRESMVGLEEAHLEAGRSPGEAKALTASLLLPQLAQIKWIGAELGREAERRGTAGDSAGQQRLLAAVRDLGGQMRDANGANSGVILTDLVGLAIENIALKNWPSQIAAPAEWEGTIADTQARNKIYREQIREGTDLVNLWLPNAPEHEIVAYLNRSQSLGEFSAINWLRDRHPELILKPSGPFQDWPPWSAQREH